MAEIIIEKVTVKAHKGHKCLFNPFYQGFSSLWDYCPMCGEYLVVQEEITNHRCSECRELLLGYGAYDYKYCPYCGVKFDKEV